MVSGIVAVAMVLTRFAQLMGSPPHDDSLTLKCKAFFKELGGHKFEL